MLGGLGSMPRRFGGLNPQQPQNQPVMYAPPPMGQPGTTSVPQHPGYATDTNQIRAQLGGMTQGLQGPDRMQIATDALKTFGEQQGDAEKLGLRSIGRANAAGGRLGSGMASTDVGNLYDKLHRNQLQFERGLAGDVASQTLSDRMMALEGTRGALGSLGNMDMSTNAMLQDIGFGGGSSALQQLIASQYGQQAQGSMGSTGELLRLLFSQGGQGGQPTSGY